MYFGKDIGRGNSPTCRTHEALADTKHSTQPSPRPERLDAHRVGLFSMVRSLPLFVLCGLMPEGVAFLINHVRARSVPNLEAHVFMTFIRRAGWGVSDNRTIVAQQSFDRAFAVLTKITRQNGPL